MVIQRKIPNQSIELFFADRLGERQPQNVPRSFRVAMDHSAEEPIIREIHLHHIAQPERKIYA